MKLILAQGNPGAKYAATRHNVGFTVLEAYAHKMNTNFVSKTKFQAEIAEVSSGQDKLLLVKPTSFYNLTGQVARALVDFYKLDASRDLLVLHDDLALPLGTLRTRLKGSDAGNNGIKSINAHLGPDYARLRIGVDTPEQRSNGDSNFVLGRFSELEAEILNKLVIPKSLDVIDDFINDKFTALSHRLIVEQTEETPADQS